jgi:predicted nucleotidyltransferase
LSPPAEVLEIAGILADVCERLRLSYALGGAIAQNFWGVVRATQDVDLLVSVPRLRFEELRGALVAERFTSLDEQENPVPLTVERMVAEERDRHVVIIARDLVKAEVFFPFLPLQHSILRRAVKLKLGSREVPITTAEDLILLKLAFHREKDLRDIRGILAIQKDRLDLAYLRDWAGKMLSDSHRDELERWVAQYWK